MEVLGIVIAGLGMVLVVYVVVYTIPQLLMRFVRSVKRRRSARAEPDGLDPANTYEIYISLRAA